MVAVYLIVELEKALVDPLLMPFVRPVLNFAARHTPAWLREKPSGGGGGGGGLCGCCRRARAQ